MGKIWRNYIICSKNYVAHFLKLTTVGGGGVLWLFWARLSSASTRAFSFFVGSRNSFTHLVHIFLLSNFPYIIFQKKMKMSIEGLKREIMNTSFWTPVKQFFKAGLTYTHPSPPIRGSRVLFPDLCLWDGILKLFRN